MKFRQFLKVEISRLLFYQISNLVMKLRIIFKLCRVKDIFWKVGAAFFDVEVVDELGIDGRVPVGFRTLDLLVDVHSFLVAV